MPIAITSPIALTARTIIRLPMASAVQSVSITIRALSLVKAVLLTATPAMVPKIALIVRTTTLSRITRARNVEMEPTSIQLLHRAKSVQVVIALCVPIETAAKTVFKATVSTLLTIALNVSQALTSSHLTSLAESVSMAVPIVPTPRVASIVVRGTSRSTTLVLDVRKDA